MRDVVPRLLDEANSIGQSCFPDVKRTTRTGPAPNHKPSLLQDYELGRAMEIDALVRAPAAFAQGRGPFHADARFAGGPGHPSGAGQGAVRGLNVLFRHGRDSRPRSRVPANVFLLKCVDVDARHKPGHDELELPAHRNEE